MVYKAVNLNFYEDAFEVLQEEANLNNDKNCISLESLKIGRLDSDIAETIEIICNGMESWGWELVTIDNKVMVFRK